MSLIASTQNPATPVVAAPGSTAKSTIGSDFNMFLKLLTTQMQNQDPLSPMDSAQYTQQLVQYSQVEQSVLQSGTLKDILASLSTQSVSQAAGFIGRDAEFDTAVAGLGAKPASWTYAAAGDVTTGTATITDALGKVVDTRTVALTGKNGSYSWDGLLPNGMKATDGAYTLSLSAQNAAGATIPITIRSIGTVTAVNAVNGVVTLGVNGAQLPVGKLVSLAVAG
ncbi:flagellar hook capping protein [Sphingomonas sp. HMWF008]|nr:flagellar hook capping protein [Sphingomonas sp. HMWF008]